MQAEKDVVVTILYKVTDTEGLLVDSNIDFEPLSYLHGAGNILPALENLLEGAIENEERQILLLPHQAYGEYKKELVMELGRDALPGLDKPEPGMIIETADGKELEIIETHADKIIVNGNHPLAGKKLHFKIAVISVRPATPAELNSGRPVSEDASCGPGCCC